MICVGTAGYSYKDWIGPFYPEGIKAGAMLEHYAMHFNFVEVNSSYYHMPGQQLFSSINRKTRDDFKVAVKLFSGFTHEREADRVEADKFMYAVKPLQESGKLVCLLAQFPYSFHYNAANCDYLKQLREWFGETEVNVEFRNQDWIRQESIQLLRNENLGFVCVDEPGLKGLIRKVTASTSRVSYLRMHGRNAAKWYGGEGSDRYNYLYSRDELLEWIPRINELEEESGFTVISFNNHPLGKAVENAKAMTGLLAGMS
jgi:uncharacterized protein YecE (DUF72 family)